MTDRHDIEERMRYALAWQGRDGYEVDAREVEDLCRQYIELRERSRADTRPSLAPVTDEQLEACRDDGIDVWEELEDAT